MNVLLDIFQCENFPLKPQNLPNFWPLRLMPCTVQEIIYDKKK